jgi:hypothetical protein
MKKNFSISFYLKNKTGKKVGEQPIYLRITIERREPGRPIAIKWRGHYYRNPHLQQSNPFKDIQIIQP